MVAGIGEKKQGTHASTPLIRAADDRAFLVPHHRYHRHNILTSFSLPSHFLLTSFSLPSHFLLTSFSLPSYFLPTSF
ncbi:MAG: hypothetical protein KXJ53_00125, partial [Phenylobacterium sp.]|nr:hypothetical protein [Phenylobacterium sp.]